MKITHAALLLIFSLLFYACSSENEEGVPIFFGYSYAPLKIDQSNVYKIDSIIYNDFTSSIDTVSFFQKEKVHSRFVDGSGRLAYRIEVSERQNDTSNWRVKRREVWLRNELRFEKQIDNLRKIHLVFPVREGESWDANALNPNESTDYTYITAHKELILNGQRFDSTVSILQMDEENLVERFYEEERYASQIGLIYRRDIRLRLRLNGEVEKGYVYTKEWLEKQP